MRVVSVLEVADVALWSELEALVPLADHVVEVLDARRRVVGPRFERDLLPQLQGRVLVRYARRSADQAAQARVLLGEEVAALRSDFRKVLYAAQRHALDEVVVGRQAWDPEQDAQAVRALCAAGLMTGLADDTTPYEGRYQLHPDLPDPPAVAYDFADAVMDETDDLAEPKAGPVQLLHDMASLAAGLERPRVRMTHDRTVTKADSKRLGRRLAARDLADGASLEGHTRWGKALRGLEALHMISLDAATRELHLDLGLEGTLAGETEDACDRLVHRLVDRDLHVVVPAVRAALKQAGQGAIDEMVFLELLRDQHRDVIFPAWLRQGERVYPSLIGDDHHTYDEDSFDEIEARMVRTVLARMVAFGLIRRAPGVFAGTVDGRRWARAGSGPHPPIWVSGDLEIIVPPDSITPWERFQIERLGPCLQRDVVDRYRLEREGLVTWLSTHDVSEALALLARRCPGLPKTVTETLEAWAGSAQRVVLTRGVLVEDGA